MQNPPNSPLEQEIVTPKGRPRTVSDDEIFGALADVVAEMGPAGATLHRVAERVGLTGPALGHRFGSKRGLLIASARRQTEATAELVEVRRGRSISPVDDLVESLLGMASAMRTKREVAHHLGMLVLDLADEDFAHATASQSRALRQYIAGLLEQAGVEKPERSAEEIYSAWIGAILMWAIDGEGYLLDWLETRLRTTIDRMPKGQRAG